MVSVMFVRRNNALVHQNVAKIIGRVWLLRTREKIGVFDIKDYS